MEANSIITEKKQTPKPIDPNASDGFDEDTILDLLDIRMRKYLQKSQESNIKVICAECERILERLKVSKERQKVLVKSWMRKFIGR